VKIRYDPNVDALYIELRKAQVETVHWSDNVAADYDDEGHLCGIEILDASKEIGDLDALKSLEFKQYELTRRE
jgi:uncharacterized protein YuzE